MPYIYVSVNSNPEEPLHPVSDKIVTEDGKKILSIPRWKSYKWQEEINGLRTM